MVTSADSSVWTPQALAYWLCPAALWHDTRCPVQVRASTRLRLAWQRHASAAWLRADAQRHAWPVSDALLAVALLAPQAWVALQTRLAAHLASEALRQGVRGSDVVVWAEWLGEPLWREAVLSPRLPKGLFPAQAPTWTGLSAQAVVSQASALAAVLTQAAFEGSPPAVRDRALQRLAEGQALPQPAWRVEPAVARQWMASLAEAV